MSARRKQSGTIGETGIVRTVDEIKRNLLATEGIERDLTPIVNKGADRDALLNLLAKAVMGKVGPSDSNRIRKKQLELRSIARQVRTVIEHAERVANNRLNYLEFFSPFTNSNLELYWEKETRRRVGRWPFQGMREFADWAEEEARKFGLLLRHNAQKEADLSIFWLLSWVHSRTGHLFEAQLARLLTDASEAAGQATDFTPAQISKMFRRHVLPPR
jgi:hypothetical protein